MRRWGGFAAGLVALLALMAGPGAEAAGHRGLPLSVRSATWFVNSGHLVVDARIADTSRSAVRATLGYVSLRPRSGGDLTGVAAFSVPRLGARSSRSIAASGSIDAVGRALRAGRYSVLVCLDVDSQVARFTAGGHCRTVGQVAVARRGGFPRSGAPNTMITSGPSGVATDATARFAFVSTAAGSRFQCRLDGGPWLSCRSPYRLTGLVDGVHAFDVRALNRGGAPDPTSAHAGWVSAMLTPTPYMGWNTYYGVGGVFDEQAILSVAESLRDRGLARAGYRIVWLDFGWASGARDSRGDVIIDPKQWPHGLGWLTGWLHARGLLAGIYTDAGASGCYGQGVGSLGHYQQDADAFAGWGFDAVKLDFCGAGQQGLTPEVQYTQFALALANNASRRPMLLNVDNFWVPGQIDGTRPSFANSAYANYRWAPRIAQSWRTDTDIGFTRDVKFANVLRNMDHDAAHPEAAGPGHWNDPDYLGPELGMTGAQAQAQLSMWAILAAPLILGSDPRILSAGSVAMLSNPEVISIDQDPLGLQGRLVSGKGAAQVWVKPLAGGGRAVALLNRGLTAERISTSAHAIGLPRAHGYRIRDVWRRATRRTTGAIKAVVAPDTAVLYRVTPFRR